MNLEIPEIKEVLTGIDSIKLILRDIARKKPDKTKIVLEYNVKDKVKANTASKFLGIKESQMEQLKDTLFSNGHSKYLFSDLITYKANNQTILQNLEG